MNAGLMVFGIDTLINSDYLVRDKIFISLRRINHLAQKFSKMFSYSMEQ